MAARLDRRHDAPRHGPDRSKQLLGTEVSQIPVSLAGAVIAFVPLVILLLIFQKQLVRSLTAGAVK